MHAEPFESNQLLSELVVDLRAQVGLWSEMGLSSLSASPKYGSQLDMVSQCASKLVQSCSSTRVWRPRLGTEVQAPIKQEIGGRRVFGDHVSGRDFPTLERF